MIAEPTLESTPLRVERDWSLLLQRARRWVGTDLRGEPALSEVAETEATLAAERKIRRLITQARQEYRLVHPAWPVNLLGARMMATSLPLSLRPFGQHDREADYKLILGLANAQVPHDPRGNEEWLQHRRMYDERHGQRRHYIAVHLPSQEPIAYAALEQQQADHSSFRIYLVFDPQRWSFEILGTFLYQQLLRDANALQAAKLVCIEYATDVAFRTFLEGQGFRQVGDGVYNGFAIVGYEKILLGTEQQ